MVPRDETRAYIQTLHDTQQVMSAHGEPIVERQIPFPKAGNAPLKDIIMWEHRMTGQVGQCIKRYCELTGLTEAQIQSYQTPGIPEGMLKKADWSTHGKLNVGALSVVMTIMYTARLLRADCYHSTNTMSRLLHKWAPVCDEMLKRQIGYLKFSKKFAMKSMLGDPIECLQMVMFCDADFGEVLESKSTTGAFIVLIGPNTYIPLSWLLKNKAPYHYRLQKRKL